MKFWNVAECVLGLLKMAKMKSDGFHEKGSFSTTPSLPMNFTK